MSEEITTKVTSKSPRICKSCGNIFYSTDTRKKICTRDCWRTWKKTQIIPLGERFFKRVSVGSIPAHKPELGPCHVYQTSWTNNGGYAGIFIRKGEPFKGVHCVAWEMEHGPIPEGMEVLHACDNKLCVRVSHLSIGTHAKNMQEAWERNTTLSAHNRSTPITENVVRMIRYRHQNGERICDLSKELGIKSRTIDKIVHYRRWKHVKDELLQEPLKNLE